MNIKFELVHCPADEQYPSLVGNMNVYLFRHPVDEQFHAVGVHILLAAAAADAADYVMLFE